MTLAPDPSVAAAGATPASRASDAAPSLAVEARGIVKRFPGVLANDAVDFDLRRGEVHALLGENGAGKSTLMNILAGLYRPDAGEIRVEGQPVAFGSPRDAIAAGLGMVHQHFTLVPSQTVTENVLLGLDQPRFLLRGRSSEAEIGRLAERFGLRVDPGARIWQLSVGEQQRVEILKMLYRGARILIMDEPTAVLAPQEADELFATLRSMTAEGRSVVFISHKLGEVLAIADRITVMRRGRVTASGVPAAGATKADLARLMVGRSVLEVARPDAVRAGRGRARGPGRVGRERPRPAGAARRDARRARGRDRRDRGRRGQRPERAGRGRDRPPARAGARSSSAGSRSPTGRPGPSSAGASPTCRRTGRASAAPRTCR